MIVAARRFARLGFVALAALATASACSAGGGGPTDSGSDAVVVLASAGTTPTYTWSGAPAVSINVARASAPSIAVWGIASTISRNIVSGVTHGAPPPSGAVETATSERTLTSGVKYRVIVALSDGTSGSVDFTP